ncbi:MAG: AAA family ATPase, partial [Desulfatirhabdiaceae bacterium]|nr:AAA family ATPase [Desulfatirhabdiaceae bacterium]
MLEKVQQFIDRVNRNREIPVLDDPLSVLQKFELLRDGRVTRAAFFLFMAHESDLSTIELGRFQTPTIIKDGARLQTDLFAEVDGVMAFIRKHINKAYIITGEPEREERWDYPLDAIREIVLNAIVHRDYASSTDSIVKIFDHKIEIINPGRLPADITIERLLEGNYISFTRNRK